MQEYIQKIELYFELKGSPKSTKESYFRRISAFIKFVKRDNRCIRDISEKDIQQYILYLKNQKGLSAGTINNYVSAIKFFYTYILEKEWDPMKIPRMKKAPHFPVIPAKEDVIAIIDATTNLKHKAIFALMYGSGLRVSEAVGLQIGDICSKTMRIRVNNAKHGTNRYTILSQFALEILRQYFKAYFTHGSYTVDDWLFKGREQGEHINVKTIKNTLIKVRDRLGLDNKISSHTLRHCFATYSLENGTDPVFIQQMLGHKSLKTTTQYMFMTSKSMMEIRSPLDGKL